MIRRTRVCLAVLGLLLLAFLFDTQLIVLRDDGMFTLHYNVPDEMKGKMYTGASWYSDSFMCRHLSFGSGRFEGTEYGDAFDNVEEKPGKWVSHIPTKVWHPFCTWELGRLTIGMDANEERTQFYDLAHAYLFDGKKSDSEIPANHKQIEDGVNESFLVCDVSESDYKKIYPDRKYIEKKRSYKCKNPNSRGATHMSAIPSVSFNLKDFGKINISLSENKILYITKNYYDNSKVFTKSLNKDITFKDNEIVFIDSTLSKNLFWKIKKIPDAYVLTEVNTKLREKNQTLIKITPEQLTYLASDDVWELPDFLKH